MAQKMKAKVQQTPQLPKVIGLSLSFCVLDIVAGKPTLDEVEKIIAGTKCLNDETWNKLIEDYRCSHWAENPDECEKVCRQLLAEGKVFQPHLRNDMAPRLTVRHGLNGSDHWVSSEAEIKWKLMM